MKNATLPLISVVMPVYNTRSFLPFTLKNIIEDQFSSMCSEDWELIVVDDGSTDGSHTEVEPWIERYPNSIKLIRTKNAGVSAARNTGLAAARGHYVYFIDSDDILLRGALPRLLTLTLPSSPDLIKFGYRQILSDEYNTLTMELPAIELRPDDIATYDRRQYLDTSKCLCGAPVHFSNWQTIYKRRLLDDNNILYLEDLSVGEDVLFCWQAVMHAKIICNTPAAVYLYHQRMGSISNDIGGKYSEFYELQHFEFLTRMLNIRKKVVNELMASEAAVARMDELFVMEHYYPSLAKAIVNGLSLRKTYGVMHRYHKNGGEVHPGRPRLTKYYKADDITLRSKIRRVIVAYIFGFYLSIIR